MPKEITKKAESIFDSFTGKYSLSKTLRFSLTPVLTERQENEIKKEKMYEHTDQIRRQDRVEKFFIDNKQIIFEEDIERKKHYKALKYYLTELHRLFIKDALNKIKGDSTIEFSTLYQSYKEFEFSKDDKQKRKLANDINNEKAKLAKYFGDKNDQGGVFQETAKKYYDYFVEKKGKENIKGSQIQKDGFSKGASNILLSQNVLSILEGKINDGIIQEKTENDKNRQDNYSLSFVDIRGNEITLIEYFSGWSTYFKNFNEIRGNLYKDNGRKEGAEESDSEARIKKANAGQLTARILDENFEIFVRNAVWAEKNKKDLKLSDLQGKDAIHGISIFDSKFYSHCLLQTDINIYNETIADVNKFFNENKKGSKVKYLKPLFKQLLLSDKPEGEEDDFVQEFVDDDDLINGLDEFYSHVEEKIQIISGFLKDTKMDSDIADIQLNENQLHSFCNKYFGSWSYLRNLYYRKNNVTGNDQSKEKGEFKDKEGIAKADISLAEIKELLENESKEDFAEAVKRGWFCFDYETQKTDLSALVEAGTYQEVVSNFENFIAFLKFEINSLLCGRMLLSKKETSDKSKITEIKTSLEEKKDEGERIDDLLLSKFSEEGFAKNIAESIVEKQEKFKQAFKQLKVAVESKKKLSRDKDFECKRVINEYCARISDINRFFALFTIPEGVDGNSFNKSVHKFKEDNKIAPLFNAI